MLSQITDFENLHRAWIAAKQASPHNGDALEYAPRAEINLLRLQKELRNNTWIPHPYRRFTIREPKLREIAAPYFEDRIVHHALVNIVRPFFEEAFIDNSFACRPEKGTHAAVDKLQEELNRISQLYQRPYVVKADVSKYFKNIDHAILKELIRLKIHDEPTLTLWDRIIDAYGDDPDRTRGLPIGSLTSQLGANIYLDAFDHCMIEKHRVPSYIRYMDDFIVLAPDKEYAVHVLELASSELEMLKLKLNPKTKLFPASHGIDFAGYRVWPSYRLPRKRVIKNLKKKLKRFRKDWYSGRLVPEHARSVVASYLGYTKHCKAYTTMRHIYEEYPFLHEIIPIGDFLHR